VTSGGRSSAWRSIRILILLLVLLFVALDSWFTGLRTTSWERPLQVAVYPINADGSEAAERFIASRQSQHLSAVEKFFATEARQYGITLAQPLELKWTAPLAQRPPLPAEDAGPLSVALWSLRMRYWAWRAPEPPGWTDIKLFVLYYDPARSPRLRHSLGMRKGLYAVVNAFADDSVDGSNQVILAHELLHTLGAMDLYDLRTNQPLHPAGFAEPDRQPLYPQRFAEIMGGRIPLSPTEALVPESLEQVIVGPATAAQIRWTPHERL
jgi:hypothetical protein